VAKSAEEKKEEDKPAEEKKAITEPTKEAKLEDKQAVTQAKAGEEKVEESTRAADGAAAAAAAPVTETAAAELTSYAAAGEVANGSLQFSLAALNEEREDTGLLSVGASVRVHSLVGQTEHNNTVGTLETHDARTGRWKVKMSGSGQVLTLKAPNLMLVSTSGSSLAQTHATQSDAAVAPVLSSTPSTPGSTADAGGLSSKFAMDIKALVTFGIELFDSTLQEQLGPADGDILRAMYAEHCLDHDAKEPYYADNIDTTTWPEQEFEAIVGQDGIDRTQGQWTLKPDAKPTLYPGYTMVKGRNAKTIKKLMKAAEAKKAGLIDVEIIGLRLISGPQHVKYNGVLRALALGEEVTGSKYSTTIQVIVSAIRKLASVAEVPKDNVVHRGVRVKVALDSEFYVLDFQGFAGGVESSFMHASRDINVAREYSGAGKGCAGTIFKLVLGKMSLGADISW
jgi:hypothetical protein